MLLASANHDPEQFESRDSLDVRRKNARQHVGLGVGVHTCLGTWLTRLETEVAVTGMLRRFPDLALGGPVNRLNFTLHGPAELQLDY